MTGGAAAVSITPARRDDLPAVLALERVGFPEPEQWSERSWAGELLGEGRTVLLARAGQVVGVVAFRTTGEHADLHRLVVAPGHRREGLGTALVLAGLDAVRHLGARAVLLEVDYDNEPAIALYQHLGFEQLTARRDYYGPGQDALILKLYDLDTWPARYAAQLGEEAAERAQQGSRPAPVVPPPPAVPADTEEQP
ncbi:ribosomal-protein-alanine N-acetyltransferase [Friedmanniella luteola]|uniref:Ribosomal-protein-alanine N-acetyltransferase n=1 Tax=Friedmanniella luteola TaxID=546871 RepID=A0A1H1YV72_9ACTN|nr:GNAT family N-acetyltransferase [Friedmanniella luteola]SDT25219.1 ribosomal-protein-alanine N-acetyltransferase [Friedmanniella luteola]